MKVMLTLSLMSILMLFCSDSYAANKLFKSVSYKEQSEAEERNREELIRTLYFAEEYRFVKVNLKALEENDDITVDLFNGESYDIRYTGRDTTSVYGDWWLGEVTEVAEWIDELKPLVNESNKEAFDILSERSKVKISYLEYFLDRDTNDTVKWRPILKSFGTLLKKKKMYSRPNKGQESVIRVSFDYIKSKNGDTYELRYLKQSPSIYLFYKRNPEKRIITRDVLPGQNYADRFKTSDPNTQAYWDYLESHDLLNMPKTEEEIRLYEIKEIKTRLGFLIGSQSHRLDYKKRVYLRSYSRLKELGLDDDELGEIEKKYTIDDAESKKEAYLRSYLILKELGLNENELEEIRKRYNIDDAELNDSVKEQG